MVRTPNPMSEDCRRLAENPRHLMGDHLAAPTGRTGPFKRSARLKLLTGSEPTILRISWRSRPNAHLNRVIQKYGCRCAVRQTCAARPLDNILLQMLSRRPLVRRQFFSRNMIALAFKWRVTLSWALNSVPSHYFKQEACGGETVVFGVPRVRAGRVGCGNVSDRQAVGQRTLPAAFGAV